MQNILSAVLPPGLPVRARKSFASQSNRVSNYAVVSQMTLDICFVNSHSDAFDICRIFSTGSTDAPPKPHEAISY